MIGVIVAIFVGCFIFAVVLGAVTWAASTVIDHVTAPVWMIVCFSVFVPVLVASGMIALSVALLVGAHLQ